MLHVQKLINNHKAILYQIDKLKMWMLSNDSEIFEIYY